MAMELVEQNVEVGRKITVEELNSEILPVIYEIIRGIEKDHHDNTVKTRESQDCSLRVLELQKRLDETRAEIRQLPGIEHSKEQQLNNLEALKSQLKLKQELLQKYIANNERLVQRLSESYPIQTAARFAVYIFNRGKGIVEEQDLKSKLDATRVRQFIQRFSSNVKEEIENVKQELKKKK